MSSQLNVHGEGTKSEDISYIALSDHRRTSLVPESNGTLNVDEDSR